MAARISIGDINEEVGYARERRSSLGDPQFRALVGIPDGRIAISDFDGFVGIELDEPNIGGGGAWDVTPIDQGANGDRPIGNVGPDSFPWHYHINGSATIAELEFLVGGNATSSLDAGTREAYMPEAENSAVCVRNYPFNQGESGHVCTIIPDADFQYWASIGAAYDDDGVLHWAMCRTGDKGFEYSTLYSDVGDGKLWDCILPTYRRDPNARDGMVVTDTGQVWHFPDLFTESGSTLVTTLTGWVQKEALVRVRGQGKQIRCISYRDSQNWAYADTQEGEEEADGTATIWIFRDGSLTRTVFPLTMITDLYWDQLRNTVISVGARDNGDGVDTVWSYDSTNLETVRATGVEGEIWAGHSCNSYGLIASRYKLLEDQILPAIRFNFADNWASVEDGPEFFTGITGGAGGWGGYYGRANWTAIVCNARLGGDRGVMKFIPDEVSKLEIGIARTDAFVEQHPRLKEKWEKIKVDLQLT